MPSVPWKRSESIGLVSDVYAKSVVEGQILRNLNAVNPWFPRVARGFLIQIMTALVLQVSAS